VLEGRKKVKKLKKAENRMKKNPGVTLQAAEGQKPPVVGFLLFLSLFGR
jgi:hypothetical protein